jgi:hypothetical protein
LHSRVGQASFPSWKSAWASEVRRIVETARESRERVRGKRIRKVQGNAKNGSSPHHTKSGE